MELVLHLMLVETMVDKVVILDMQVITMILLLLVAKLVVLVEEEIVDGV